MQRLGRGAIATGAFALAFSALGDHPVPGMARAGAAKSWDTGIDVTTGSEQTETESILQFLHEMTACWNRHDIEGYTTCFWHSDELVAVIDQEVVRGWDALYRSYEKGYSDRNAMGSFSITRVEVDFLAPDLAAVITWWAFEYTPRHTEVMGTSTMNLRRFPDGWRIIFSHSVF